MKLINILYRIALLPLLFVAAFVAGPSMLKNCLKNGSPHGSKEFGWMCVFTRPFYWLHCEIFCNGDRSMQRN